LGAQIGKPKQIQEEVEMRFNLHPKLNLILAFLLTASIIGSLGLMAKAQAQRVIIVPKDSAAKLETPVKDTAATTSVPVKDTTDKLAMAMEDFHSVLAPLWHDAYPNKDFKSLREQAPLFKGKLMNLLVIPAPDTMVEEKREVFFTKRQELAFYVDQYEKAAADSTDSVLAASFEKMHWGYEELNKVFMVEIKQMDSFHETLYYLIHKALPAKDYKSIKETVPVLKAEMDSLMLVKLPGSCYDIKDAFEAKRAALKDAVYQLSDVCQNGTNQQIDDALAAMHDKYMDLNMVLQ
jgi:hypothetical protein